MQLGFFYNVLPKRQQLFFLHFTEFDAANNVQHHGRGHGNFLAWILVNGAAQRVFLFNQPVAQLVVDGGEAGRQTGWPAAHNKDVQQIGRAAAWLADAFADRANRLASLLRGFADQAHAAEFAGYENAGHIGLKTRADIGNVDAALFGSENQLDGVKRTGWQASAVANAVGRVDEHGFAIDDAQRPLRADLGAGTGANAAG